MRRAVCRTGSIVKYIRTRSAVARGPPVAAHTGAIAEGALSSAKCVLVGVARVQTHHARDIEFRRTCLVAPALRVSVAVARLASGAVQVGGARAGVAAHVAAEAVGPARVAVGRTGAVAGVVVEELGAGAGGAVGGGAEALCAGSTARGTGQCGVHIHA